MFNQLPKVSIITPTFNSEKYIENCILSVASQDYENKEHIIVDGASTDATVEIVKTFSSRYPHIRWISEDDLGIYDAMNKGTHLSLGKWLYFMGSDDVFVKKNILSLIFRRKNISHIGMLYGDVFIGDRDHVFGGEFDFERVSRENISHQAIFYSRGVFDNFGGYNLRYSSWSDWDLNFRCFLDEDIQKEYIPLIITRFALGGYSSRHKDFILYADRSELFRECLSEECRGLYKGALETAGINYNS